ncbi:MoaD/ThiS family protein [Terriglobus albidus]|uniref:MoaD/ThiS family protein n=1 Tax=Terriglobus albidus TaxID=1592106 RepID=UPI0021E0F1C5|nr:MoaD/ThiS family protein [Terriglobus albidus]
MRVLYFGVLKELFACPSEDVEVETGCNVGALRKVFHGRMPHTAWKSMAIAVNQEYAGDEVLLHEGDEVALLPPVSGGAPGNVPWKKIILPSPRTV